MELDGEVMNIPGEMEDSDTVEERKDKTAEGEEGEEEESSGTTTTTSAFIQELNLVLILAFLSLSADERLEFEDIKQIHEYTDPKGNPSVSTSQFKRRQLNIDGFRHPERQISRSNSKIQDCRHGRRV